MFARESGASKDIAKVVDRLRASKRQQEAAGHAEGFGLGRQWAENKASPVELERLAEARESQSEDEWGSNFESCSTSEDRYGPGYVLFFTMNPDEDNTAAVDFWTNVLFDPHSNKPWEGAFVRGFAEGALEVWDEVKDQA